MPTFIEKLKSPVVDSLTRLTLIDLIHGNHNDSLYSYQNHKFSNYLIKDDVSLSLANNDIYLGKFYGTTGIELSDALDVDRVLHLEIPVGHIRFFDIDELAKLSFKHKILFIDLEEGNCVKFKWRNKSKIKIDFFDDFLRQNLLSFNLDNLTLISSGFTRSKYCKLISIDKFWVTLTALSTPFIVSMIKNNNQDYYIDLIKNKKHDRFAVFKNWRARQWRVALLSKLHANNMLDVIDWSLIGDYGPLFYDRKEPRFELNDFFQFTDMEWYNRSEFKSLIDNFFNVHLNKLPKFLYNDDVDNDHSIMHTAESDFKKYRFSIDVESGSWISEKLIKNMLLGTMPIVIYPYSKTNHIKKIKNLGFNVLDLSFDNFENIEDLINLSTDFIKMLYQNDMQPAIDDVIHNFEMCTNIDKLSSYVYQPLIDTFK